MRRALVDTDTLSEYLKAKNEAVAARADQYLAQFGSLSFSLITRYEVLRGLKAKNATRQLQHFEVFCSANEVLPLTDAIIVRAADLYAELRGRGELISDADLLVAATALESGLVLVTGNVQHFRRVPALRVVNWAE